MKKILLLILSICILSSSAYACDFFKKKPFNSTVKTANLFNSQITDDNTVWVGTFQLLWNNLSDNYVKGPIVFSNGQIPLAEELNKQEFNKTMLSENAYYTTYGVMTKSFKREIEDALKKKFNDKSDILDSFDWNGKNFLAYAMLKKDFQFVKAFAQLEKGLFANSGKKVKYFGLDKNSNQAQRDSVTVLFHNADNDFALKLTTKAKDKVILYRTDSKESFENIYNALLEKARVYEGSRIFLAKDKFKVPYLEFNTKHTYDELANKHIKGTDLTIDKALQTVKFKMDNKGVQLKSEAAMIMKMSLAPSDLQKPRNFYFDDTFVLFLIENEKPYFALKVVDVNGLK